MSTSRPTISRTSSSSVVAGRTVADAPAVAQHRHAVAEREHFGHAMRDVDDRHAVGLSAIMREQPLDLGLGERRGRLVHHQDARVLRQRLGDFDHLLLRDAERVHERVSISTPSISSRRALRGASGGDRWYRERPRLAAEKDVLREAEVGNEREFLEDDRDAEPPRVGGEPIATGWP